MREKGKLATKKQFSLLLSSVFSWSADSEQACLGLGAYDNDAFVHCVYEWGMGVGVGERYSKRSALCVCRHNQKYFECFLCKVRRFFSLCCLTVTVLFFACRFCSTTLNVGGGAKGRLQQFLGLVSTTPDRVLLIFEAHFWARHGKLRAKSCG